jgi:hypothetical protein
MCPDKHTYKSRMSIAQLLVRLRAEKVRDFLLETSMKTFYVYGHFVPNSKEPFYIGKGTGRRYKKNDNRNKWWKNIVGKYGFEPKILHDGLTEDVAAEMEKQLIKEYGRRDLGTGILVNLTDGGETSCGAKHTDEERKQIGEKSVENWMKKTPNERHQIGLVRWQNMTEEMRQQHRKNVGKSSKGRKHTEESRKKNAAAQKRVWKSKSEEDKQEHREAGRNNSKKYWENITPEQLEAHRKRSRETALRRWQKREQHNT